MRKIFICFLLLALCFAAMAQVEESVLPLPPKLFTQRANNWTLKRFLKKLSKYYDCNVVYEYNPHIRIWGGVGNVTLEQVIFLINFWGTVRIDLFGKSIVVSKYYKDRRLEHPFIEEGEKQPDSVVAQAGIKVP